jgi:prophage regulatory protein
MPDEIIRKADLPKYTGLKRTAIDDLISQGKFPPPIQLSARAVGWLGSEITKWQLQRKEERDANASA